MARGDEDFGALFEEVFMVARRVAYRVVGDTFLAEDIAVEAFTRLYVRWARLRTDRRRRGWVLKVTANLAIDAVRRGPAPLGLSAAPDPEEAAVLRVALAAALVKLPARQRSVISLRYLADLSEAEIALALGISRGSVKTHAHRGLGQLRRFLSDQEVDLALDR